MTAEMLLDQLSPKFAEAQVVAPVDERLKVPLVIQSAEVDERINAGWPAYEAALKALASATSGTSTRARK